MAVGASAVMRHPQGLKIPGGGTELRIELPLASMGAQASKGASVHDLTAHPWAGLTVAGHLEAKDGRGQIGKTETVSFVIPERTFNHPVARALVEQRKVAIAVDGYWQEGFDPGLAWFFLTLPSDGDAGAAEAAFTQELEAVARDGVTAAELDKAKSLVTADFWRALATIVRLWWSLRVRPMVSRTTENPT